MRKFATMLIIVISIVNICLVPLCFSQNEAYIKSDEAFRKKFGIPKSEGLNPKQPISAGEYIYEDALFCSDNGIEWLEAIYCKYEGIQNNSLKIQVTKKSLSADNAEEVETLFLPLNWKKQAIFKVVPAAKNILPSKELVITVDNFSRLKVEEKGQGKRSETDKIEKEQTLENNPAPTQNGAVSTKGSGEIEWVDKNGNVHKEKI